MGDVCLLACLLLVTQWPQPAIKSAMHTLIVHLRLISNGRCAVTRACLKYILIVDAPSARLRLLCNTRCDEGDVRSTHLCSRCISAMYFSRSDRQHQREYITISEIICYLCFSDDQYSIHVTINYQLWNIYTSFPAF
jgi:hypothetical protein